MIFLLILFICKLIQVYQSVTPQNSQSLVKPITRTTILTTIATIMTFTTSIFLSVHSIFSDSILFIWIVTIIALCNMYINFICIILCHTLCKQCVIIV